MLSLDTNVLFAAVEVSHAQHAEAASFLASLDPRGDVAISEFVLLELYVLLRSPAVLTRPLDAPSAMAVCQAFRVHPRWQVLGFPNESRAFHDAFWPRLATPGFARRRAFDWRMALALLRQGVTEFATVNTRDFAGFGFERVWNPLSPP